MKRAFRIEYQLAADHSWKYPKTLFPSPHHAEACARDYIEAFPDKIAAHRIREVLPSEAGNA